MKHSTLRWFEYRHLPPHLQNVSAICSDAVMDIENLNLDQSAELSAGYRKMVEAKDCFVRAAILTKERQDEEAQGAGVPSSS